MKKALLFLMVSCLSVACGSSGNFVQEPEPETPARELKLSVKGSIYTDGVDFEFEILDGNGGYTAEGYDPDEAKVTIEGRKVKVNLLSDDVKITITDAQQQSASIVVNSSAKELWPIDYTLFIPNGDVYTMDYISFGVGGYSVEKVAGNSATVIIDDSDNVHVTTLKQGNSYFKLIDKRGTTAPLCVMVGTTYDMLTSTIEVVAVNDQTFSITLKYGNGDWQLVTKEPYAPIIDKIYLMHKATTDKQYDVIQVDTAKGNTKGRATIELRDRDGHLALITVKIE